LAVSIPYVLLWPRSRTANRKAIRERLSREQLQGQADEDNRKLWERWKELHPDAQEQQPNKAVAFRAFSFQ
jgi:hypothetical protein